MRPMFSKAGIPVGMPSLQTQAHWTPTLAQRLLPPLAFGIVVAACVAMSCRTWVRNTDWEDNTNLAIATARDNPNSAKSCFWAGNILASPGSPDQFKDFGQSLLHRAIELYPHYGEAYFELAKDQRLDGDLAASLICLAQAAQYGPGKGQIRGGLDAIIPDLQSYSPDLYMPDLIAYERANPDSAAANLALAMGYFAMDDLPDADFNCAQALALDQHFHEAACELALIRLQSGRPDLAIQLLMQYVAHVRSNPGARFLLAQSLMNLDPVTNPGAYAKAEFFLNEAEQLAKDDPRCRTLRADLTKKRTALAATKSQLPVLPAISDAREGRE